MIEVSLVDCSYLVRGCQCRAPSSRWSWEAMATRTTKRPEGGSPVRLWFHWNWLNYLGNVSDSCPDCFYWFCLDSVTASRHEGRILSSFSQPLIRNQVLHVRRLKSFIRTLCFISRVTFTKKSSLQIWLYEYLIPACHFKPIAKAKLLSAGNFIICFYHCANAYEEN